MKKILIPLDGSELAEKAFQFIADVLAPNGCVTLITIIQLEEEPYFPTVAAVSIKGGGVSAADERRIQAAQDYLAQAAKKLRAEGINVETIVETGYPPKVITTVGRRYDAIMMTTHGRTGFGRLLYGSVAQQVIGLATTPVIIVPSEIREREPAP